MLSLLSAKQQEWLHLLDEDIEYHDDLYEMLEIFKLGYQDSNDYLIEPMLWINNAFAFADETNNKILRRFKRKYYLTTPTIVNISLDVYKMLTPETLRREAVRYDEQSNKIILKLDPAIKYEQFNYMWNEVKRIRDIVMPSKTKDKAAEDMLLVYCIHKMRINNTSFDKIAKLYADGKLPGYDKKPKTYLIDEDKLANYYKKHTSKLLDR